VAWQHNPGFEFFLNLLQDLNPVGKMAVAGDENAFFGEPDIDIAKDVGIFVKSSLGDFESGGIYGFDVWALARFLEPVFGLITSDFFEDGLVRDGCYTGASPDGVALSVISVVVSEDDVLDWLGG